MKKASEISQEFKNCPKQDLKKLILEYENDGRQGVINTVAKYRKKLEDYYKELLRLKAMFDYENEYYEKGCKYIGGVDEVGRGPLAGPLVACALIYPREIVIEGVNDSKQLSEKRRNEIFWQIERNAVDIGLGVVDPEIIDEINIYSATKLAMKDAVNNLASRPDMLLIDAMKIDDVGIPQMSIIKGDEKSLTIAAASIVAKVMRDEMMYNYAKEYPQYGFESNKGYGTPSHIDAIKKYGLCPIHRRSFVKNILEQ